MKTHPGIAALFLTVCLALGCMNTSRPVTVTIKETAVGKITLGSGWNTWDHWWGYRQGRYRLEWNDQQWASYLALFKESGADWVRLDLFYGNVEPRNDNDDPEVLNWSAFTFDNPRLNPFYKHLDFFCQNDIDVYLVYTTLIDNNEYNIDPNTGWMSKYFVENGNPTPYLKKPPMELTDKRELAENLAATTYYLRKSRNYTCIKQLALYVEPNHEPTLDGFGDTIFLAKLLRKLGIRDEVKILAPHIGTPYVSSKPGDPNFPPPSDFDVYAVEDYEAIVNFRTPERGLKNLSPSYQTDVTELQKKNPLWEAALLEYGSYWCWRATDPLCSYLKTLSSSCLVFELYNSGYSGVQRWAFEPFYHPYLGFGVIQVEGVVYPPAAPPGPSDLDWNTVAAIRTAMAQGAEFFKVPHIFEPQKLLNRNLRRGSTVYRTEVADPIPPGRGIYAIAARDVEGNWRIGLINLYPSARQVEVVFPVTSQPTQLQWDYYQPPAGILIRLDEWLADRYPEMEPFRFMARATRFVVRKAHQSLGSSQFSRESSRGPMRPLINGTVSLTLSGRSINFLVQ